MGTPSRKAAAQEQIDRKRLRLGALAREADGRWLAAQTFLAEEALSLWDMSQTTGLLIVDGLLGISGKPLSLGRNLLAVPGGRGAIDLWDMSEPAAPRRWRHQLSGQASDLNALAFSPTGALRLAAAHEDGTLILWDLEPEAWMARACTLAGRSLSQSEWKQYVGAEPYRNTCARKSDGR